MRHGCHLCEEMATAVAEFDAELALEPIDIERDAELAKRFGALVPVLAEGDQVICHFELNRAALANHLGRTGGINGV